MPAKYVLKRLLFAVPTLVGVAVIVFVLLRVVPGDPVSMMIGPEATTADIERLRGFYGLDRPILDQFLIYLGNAAAGDFGISISFKQDVTALILTHLPPTLELVAFAIAVGIALGVALGCAAVYWRGRWPEMAVDGLNGIAVAIPDFLWALLLILFFGVLIPVLPVSGRIDPALAVDFETGFFLAESVLRGNGEVLATLLRHLLLPGLALALPLTAVVARVLKTSLIEAMAQDYILLARVKGFGRARTLLRHALPNALIPTVTLSGVQFMFLTGGTVLIELIFSYPGIGNLAVSAVINRDLPLIQGITLTFAVLFVLLNLLIDLTYTLMNPRVRHG